MRLLWVPHSPLQTGRSRAEHLVEQLSARHDVSILSFRVHDRLKSWRYLTDLITHRTKTTLGGVREVACWRFPKSPWLNGRVLTRVSRREAVLQNLDAIILSPASYLVGVPDFQLLKKHVVLICDYIDGRDWRTEPRDFNLQAPFIENCDATLCVSNGLTRQAKTLNSESYYIPNGVNISKYASYSTSSTTEACKRKLGIDPSSTVISIIGMTHSRSLYFLDAVERLILRGRNVTLMLVGQSDQRGEIRARSSKFSSAIKFVDSVPYSEILDYFMATDIGLYAVDDNPYFHNASPLKVLEYGAMGKRVVVAPALSEIKESALGFVTFSEANDVALADCVDKLMNKPAEPGFCLPPRLDWANLANDVEQVILNAKKRKESKKNADGPKAPAPKKCIAES